MGINLKYFWAYGERPMRFWEKLKVGLLHAFAVGPGEGGVTAEERALLEKAARLVVKRDMVAPTVLFLESVGPLGFLGSQLLHALTPLLDLVCSQAELEQMAHLLEKRESVSLLVAMIQKEDKRWTPRTCV